MIDALVNATKRLFGQPSKKGTAVDPVIAHVVKPEPIRDLADLVQDMLRDPMVVMTMSVYLSKLKGTDFTVSLDAPEGDQLADVIEDDIERLISETLEKLTDLDDGLLTWGGLPFEVVPDNVTIDGTPLSRIKQFKQLPKHVNGARATEYVLDPDGTFGGIRVTIDGSDFVIPAEQSAWFAIGATPLAPHGRSLFLGAPADVRRRRKKADALIDIFAGRWAIDGPVIHAPALAFDQFGNQVNNHELIAAQYAQNKTAGGLTILPNTPAGPGMDGKYEIDITHETRALDAAPLETLDNLIDAKMSRAFGVHESVTMDTETGSYASQTVRMFVVLSRCDSFAWAIATILQRECERFYLRANYADVGAMPSLKIVPISHITDGFLIETVKAVMAMPAWGPLLQSGAVDLATILANSGIPLARDYAERLDEAFAQVQADKDAAREQFEEEPADDESADDESADDEDEDPLFQANDDDEAHYLAVKKKQDVLDLVADVMRWHDLDSV